MTAAVLSLCEARRRREAALHLVAQDQEATEESAWRDLGNGWQALPADDGDVWIRRGQRERLFEACRLGASDRQRHCPCCARPLHQGEVAYREAEPRDEPVSWREVRICGRCVEGR